MWPPRRRVSSNLFLCLHQVQQAAHWRFTRRFSMRKFAYLAPSVHRLVGLSRFAVHLLRLVEVDNNATALWSTKFFVVILLIYLTLPRFHFSSVAQQRSTPRHPPRQGRDEVFLDIFQPCLNSAHPLARSTSFGKFESLCYVTDRADNSS